MGIEVEGYVEGAVFVLNLSQSWAPLLWGQQHAGPPAARGGGSRGRGREETGVLVVEYMGYRRWRVGGQDRQAWWGTVVPCLILTA